MAEYYPLLARAVATLRDAPAERRRAIYDRARGALLGQLRSMQPPVPPEAIERESVALDEAIARLESEMPGTTPPPGTVPPPPPEQPAAPPLPKAESALPPLKSDVPSSPPVLVPPLAEVVAPSRPPVAPAQGSPPDEAPAAAKAVVEPPVPAAPPRPAPSAPAPPPPAPVVEPPTPVVPSPTAVEPLPPAPPVSVPTPTVDPPVQPGGSPVWSRPPGAPRPMGAPPRSTVARPAAEALTRIIADKGAEPPVVRIPRAEDERGRTQTVTRVSAALPSAPKLQIQTFSDALVAAGAEAADPREREAGEAAAGRDDAFRPAAPRPIVREQFNPRFIILAVIGLLVVAGIAYTAWRLRDKPEALARSRAALAAAEQAANQQSGKISNRAEAGAAPVAAPAPTSPAGATAPAPQPTAAPAPQPSPAAPAATSAAAPDTSPAPAVAPMAVAPAPAAPPAVAQQATPGPTVGGAVDAPPPSAPAEAGIPVAQRAAFLVDAPEEASKVKTYVGTVVWRQDSISPGQNQPLAQAVRAEIDIPDIGMKLTMLFQKNFEPQFPASHTLDLRFSPSQTNPLGSVKQINVPQMRKDDSPSGDSLVGLPVTITEDYFLVGLSRGDATAHNLDLIQSRNWFDIPLLLSSGKVAKVTFEKGATGQKVIDSVMQSWQ